MLRPPLQPSRRQFLAATAATACFPGRLFAEISAAPCAPSAWQKKGEVLRLPGGPATGWIQNFTSAAMPLEAGRWRLWCSMSGKAEVLKNVGYAEGVPGENLSITWAALSSGEPDTTADLAIGNLPEGWRPVQVVPLKLKDGRHRLYFWAHSKGIVRYLAANSINGRHYRVVDPLRPCLYHPVDRAVDGSVAIEAGLRRFGNRKAAPIEDEPLAPASLISNDATNVYQLPDGSFEMYSVGLMEVPKGDPRYFQHDNIPGLIRVIDRYVSADGLQWKDRQRVIQPDSQDPSDLQFYYLSVTHTARGRVGILGHYRLKTQTLDFEWCFSTDGITWERPARRAWLPRGDASKADSYMLHAPHALVQHEAQWWLFYTGGNFAHNHRDSHGPEDRALMLATTPSIWK